jgi:hypothetical protein
MNDLVQFEFHSKIQIDREMKERKRGKRGKRGKREEQNC